MSNKKEKVVATVIEVLPNLRYRLELSDGKEILAYSAGKIRKSKISIIPGDKVEVELDPYGGKATNRIIWRK